MNLQNENVRRMERQRLAEREDEDEEWDDVEDDEWADEDDTCPMCEELLDSKGKCKNEDCPEYTGDEDDEDDEDEEDDL